MSYFRETIFVIIFATMVVMLVFFIGFAAGKSGERQRAIKAGVARYECTPEGERCFRYLKLEVNQ